MSIPPRKHFFICKEDFFVILFTVRLHASWFFSVFIHCNGKALSCLSFESLKSCLIKRLMVLSVISIFWAIIFYFWIGFQLILDLTALIICGVRTTWGRPDLLYSLTPPVSKNNLTVQYTKTCVYLTALVTKKYELFLFHTYEEQWQQYVCFCLSIPSLMAQSRMECFGTFIVYRSTVININITFGCVQFVSRKSCVYTCISIYGRIRHYQCVTCFRTVCFFISTF